ncbi:MAG: ABC transporter ATP-binding protein, partial [Asgard group archaeon]|nr:ABC transporter ATP-binding protein [Asgard group archaeon]
MIECTDLIKIYSDEQTNTRVAALRGIDLNIKKGELVSIVGPSGSGKTTLIKIIAGIESISSGKIIVDGLELNKLTSNELLNYRLRTIGMVQQFPEKTLFLSGTVFDNLTFASSLHSKNYEKNKEQNQQLMETLGISHLAHRKVNTLSGGELIRTSIACALAKKTKVILCDEPTGQLDSANTEIVKNILRKITYDFKTTVLVVTHDLRFLKDVDRTCEIHSGRVSSLYSGDSFEETTSDDFPLGFLAQVDSTQSVRIPDKVYKFLKLNDNVRFFINKDSSVVLKHPEGIPPQTIDISKHK